MKSTGMRRGACLIGTLLVLPVVAAGSAAAQASVAVEALYGRGDGPVGTQALGLGASLGVPFGVALTGELSKWESRARSDCLRSEPDPVKCDVGGWLFLAGLRVGLPLEWPVQPYLGAHFGRSVGSWTPGFDADPSAWAFEAGFRVGLGVLEASAAVRYQAVDDLGYEARFGDTPDYQVVLVRLGYAL